MGSRRKNLVIAAAVAVAAYAAYRKLQKSSQSSTHTLPGTFAALVGNTPLVRLEKLSAQLGVNVYGKAEFLNPGGSVKDRVAVQILAEAASVVPAETAIVEGTSGSTGISLALAANSIGRKCTIFLPCDQAVEKRKTLSCVGASVRLTPTVSATHPDHYLNQAARQQPAAFFADQFENLANFRAHYDHTAVEILSQLKRIDGFVASCGTGGTISGCARRLKKSHPKIRIVAGDPTGSGVVAAVEHGLMYNDRDREGFRKRVFSDSLVEGVGLNRLTKNFSAGLPVISAAFHVCDLEAVHMSRWLIAEEGLFLGSSSALNCCAVVKAVKAGLFQPGDNVVVILCDSGLRHLSRFYDNEVLRELRILPRYADEKQQTPRESCFGGPRSAKAAESPLRPAHVFDFID